MAVYLVEGAMGQGKGIYAAYRACQYYRHGLRVASNYPFDTYYLGKDCENVIDCLPICPGRESLESLGYGSADGDLPNGALFLDEGLLFLNSREFARKGRTDFNEFFTQMRKLRWDVYIMVQGIDMIDSQIRDNLIDYHVVVERLDRLRIPFVSAILEMFFPSRYGLFSKKKSVLPHVVTALTYDKKKQHKAKPINREVLKPKHYYAMYDTYFRFVKGKTYNFLGHEYNLAVGDDYRKPQDGAYTMLPGAYLRDAYKKYGARAYYPDGKNLPSESVVKQKFSVKSFISLAFLFGLGWLLWSYFLPFFFPGLFDTPDASPVEVTHSVTVNGRTYTLEQVRQIQQIMQQNGGSTDMLSQSPVPPPPPSLSHVWRLTGYIHAPGTKPRYVVRDSFGNIRYVLSDVPYSGQYTEITLDGELVTFYSGVTGQQKNQDASSLSVSDSLLSILPQSQDGKK